MEKLDKERYLKRVIIVCWIALAICFGIKLFGGNLFEIMCNNENFIKVCTYADNHFWAKYIISTINTTVSVLLYTLAICGKTKLTKRESIILIATALLNSIIKNFSMILGLLFDLWQTVIMQAVFTIKTPRKHYKIILSNLLLVLFQAVSMFVRNLGFQVLNEADGILISFIYSIDVTIMLVLYYLYSNIKKEK